MPLPRTRNISLQEYRRYLRSEGCTFDRHSGGHELWTKPGLSRPITFQTHKDPVPERIVKNNERTLATCNTEIDTSANTEKKVSVTLISKKSKNLD